jgi:hypothetical protein
MSPPITRSFESLTICAAIGISRQKMRPCLVGRREIIEREFVGVTLTGEATLEAPVRAEPHPTPMPGEYRGEAHRLLASFEEAFELPDASRMAHLAQRFGLDLADALPCDTKLPAYFLKSPAVTIHQAEPLLKNLPFALG